MKRNAKTFGPNNAIPAAPDGPRASALMTWQTPQGFEQFYKTEFIRVRAFLARHGCPRPLLDDLTQDTFVCMWQQRFAFRGQARPATFLLGIARNLLRS